jgi:hypothetical protein
MTRNNPTATAAERRRLAESDAPDLRAEPWMQLADDLEAMLGSDRYEWARRTLAGLHATITRTHQVTPAQRAAVDHIYAARLFRRRGWWW